MKRKQLIYSFLWFKQAFYTKEFLQMYAFKEKYEQKYWDLKAHLATLSMLCGENIYKPGHCHNKKFISVAESHSSIPEATLNTAAITTPATEGFNTTQVRMRNLYMYCKITGE